MYYYFLFGWFVGFCCAMILVELLYDGAERKGGYNYYDDCWEEWEERRNWIEKRPDKKF